MAKDYGLGGIMNWAIDIDDFKGTFCGQEAIFDSATHYHTFAIMSGLSKIVFFRLRKKNRENFQISQKGTLPAAECGKARVEHGGANFGTVDKRVKLEFELGHDEDLGARWHLYTWQLLAPPNRVW